MKNTLLLTASLALLTACNSQGGNYPRLLPTEQILAEPTLPSHGADAAASPATVDAQAAARADALRSRAEALKGPVIEPDVQARMQQNQ